jgi:hypothetical protein
MRWGAGPVNQIMDDANCLLYLSFGKSLSFLCNTSGGSTMTETFKKLNFKSQNPILVLKAPDSFASEISAMKAETEVHAVPKSGVRYAFVLAFGEMRTQIEEAGRIVVKMLDKDAVCWFAYPKGTSKKLKSDLNRDIMWDALLPLGIRPVRQIAIDNDWSALRFRRKEDVKS